MSKRNKSVLEFQRRLIRTAAKSPRVEAMNLLGIVYSNLKEFIQVRIPLDDDPDTLMDNFFDVLEFFNNTVERIFTNVYLNNSPDNFQTMIEDFSTEVFRHKAVPESPSLKHREICNFILEQLKKEADSDNTIAIGLTINGHFYHVLNIARYLRMVNPIDDNDGLPTIPFSPKVQSFDSPNVYAVAKESPTPEDVREYYHQICNLEFSVIGSAFKISAPAAPIPDNDAAIGVVSDWINASDSPARKEFEVVFSYNPDDGDDTAELSMVPYNSMVHMFNAPYVYTINVPNPLIVDFDRVAKVIIKSYIGHDLTTIKYKEGAESALRLRHLHYISMHYDWDYEYFRGPYEIDGHNELLDCICKNIGLVIPDLPATVEDLEKEVLRQKKKNMSEYEGSRKYANSVYPRLLVRSNMTIYRTGKFDKNCITDKNLALIIMIAHYLKSNAEFLIECRARSDERNNLALYTYLCDIGCNVKAIHPEHFDKKVHAKIWSFSVKHWTRSDGSNFMTHYHTVDLFSTGNFVDSAQSNFSDSALVTVHTGDQVGNSLGFAKNFWSSVSGLGNIIQGGVIWEPKLIRTTLLNEINGAVARCSINPRDAHRRFILIKCNHITDPLIIRALINAAKKGIMVRVIVRTTCLLPKLFIPNLEIKSIMGKYLEHDRMFIFGTVDPETRSPQYKSIYMSTSDLMPRNLDDRIEYMIDLKKFIADTEMTDSIGNIFWRMFNTPTEPFSGFFSYTL